MPTETAYPPRDQWPRHLFLRSNGMFCARVRVPPSVGHSSSHLQRSLKTANYATALRRLTGVAGDLSAEIRAMVLAKVDRRTGPASRTVEEEAAWFRDEATKRGRRLGEGEEDDGDDLDAALELAIEQRLGAVVGTRPGPRGEREPIHQGETAARRLSDLVHGRVLPIEDELDQFVKEQGLKVRYEGRCRRAAARLKTWMLANHGADDVHRVGRPEAAQFIRSLSEGGLTSPTVNSLSSSLRVYWKWLNDCGSVAGNPWVSQSRKRLEDEPLGKKRAYHDDEIVKLFNGDTYRTLHDLMRIGALSGMRINEIARLTVADAVDDAFNIRVGKTGNSVRIIPIHRDLKALVRRRVANKKLGERLFDELSGSGKRELSARASLRFTEYRRKMGVDERGEGQRQSNIDFHSWRRWFTTKAEQARQPTHVISAITGHAEGRKGMALKVYSDGPSMEQKREVVNSVRLPKGAPAASPDGPIMGRPERSATRTRTRTPLNADQPTLARVPARRA